jgi:hypothetical protein
MRTAPARGPSGTARGCARTSSAAGRRRRFWTTSARSTRSSYAAQPLSRRSPSSWSRRRTRGRSPACAACAGSTPCPLPGCAPRSATSPGLTGPASYIGLVPLREQLRCVDKARSPRPAQDTPAGYSSRPLALSQDPFPRRHAAAPPGRAARQHHRDRLAGTAAAAPRVESAGRAARQAPHDRRRRRRPRARRVLLGAGSRRLIPPDHHATSVEERRDLAHAREQQRSKHEQPPWPRPILA